MKILAIDTATENCSAALLIDGQLTTREAPLQRGAAERILPMVEELLEAAALRLAALDAIAFGRGPGGFTGVRLAASVTQGLAYAAGVAVVPVSNLRALAQRVLDGGAGPRVLVCADARMAEVYWGCFTRDAAGLAQAVGEEHLGKPEAVALPADWDAPAEVSGAGSGFAAYPQLRARLAAGLAGIEANLLPRAAEVARLAVAEVRAGRLLPADKAVPVYLRDEVARPAARH
jgi:tRNA threonylcarbamoyladenosine biosynthesis protein TsaB